MGVDKWVLEVDKRIYLKETIKTSKGIVIGISAGAINLGIDSLCSKDLDDGVEKTILYKGIGRIPYTIEPHFDINNLELCIFMSFLQILFLC